MRKALQQLRAALNPIYGRAESEAMIRLIFHALKGWSPTDMAIHEPDSLSPYIHSKIDEIIRRLIACEPIQYILGEAYFYGMNLSVGPGVLIPRPETAELVDMIVHNHSNVSDLDVLDIGTGSGAIAIALARFLPFANVTAIDISEQALAYARKNATNLHAKINFLREDILNFYFPDNVKFDIIVSNPPYIALSEKKDMHCNVTDFEPHTALFVNDSNPIVFYNRIADIGNNSLKNNGRLYFEINPRFANDIADMLISKEYTDVEIFKDINNKQRFISAEKKYD